MVKLLLGAGLFSLAASFSLFIVALLMAGKDD
jgi:hypothetical protein